MFREFYTKRKNIFFGSNCAILFYFIFFYFVNCVEILSSFFLLRFFESAWEEEKKVKIKWQIVLNSMISITNPQKKSRNRKKKTLRVDRFCSRVIWAYRRKQDDEGGKKESS